MRGAEPHHRHYPVQGGRLPPGSEMAAGGTGSNNLFTAAFGNLRQYMQEQQFQQHLRRQVPGLTASDLQLAPPAAAMDDPAETGDKSIQFFPRRPDIVPQLSKPLSWRPEPQEKSLLTILYQGQVHAFDNVPADKGMELLKLAGTWSVSQAPPKSGPPAGTTLLKRAADLPLELLDMHVRRTASVRRFLHNRQYRSPGDYPDLRMAGENEPAHLQAMHHETSTSWLHL